MCFERQNAQQAENNGMVTLHLITEAPPNYKAIALIFNTVLFLLKITISLYNQYMSSAADEVTQRAIFFCILTSLFCQQLIFLVY